MLCCLRFPLSHRLRLDAAFFVRSSYLCQPSYLTLTSRNGGGPSPISGDLNTTTFQYRHRQPWVPSDVYFLGHLACSPAHNGRVGYNDVHQHFGPIVSIILYEICQHFAKVWLNFLTMIFVLELYEVA